MRDVGRSVSTDVLSGTSSLVGAPDEVFGTHKVRGLKALPNFAAFPVRRLFRTRRAWVLDPHSVRESRLPIEASTRRPGGISFQLLVQIQEGHCRIAKEAGALSPCRPSRQSLMRTLCAETWHKTHWVGQNDAEMCAHISTYIVIRAVKD
jgi:hypothetical protein